MPTSQQHSTVRTTLGDTEYFKGIGPIQFEGLDSDNPLAYRYYDANRVVGGKTMQDHLRFAVSYWHTFCGMGGDPLVSSNRPHPASKR
jgi:xylose isomerase